MLSFSEANAKIEALKQVEELQQYLTGGRKVYSFDLLSGYSCPFAEKCLSKATENNRPVVAIGLGIPQSVKSHWGNIRKIKDGPKTEFRCFSASQEVQYNGVYDKRKANFDGLKHLNSSHDMANAIMAVMPKNTGIVRIHVAGDFFNMKYFLAWVKIAEQNPDVLFYAYTKSLNFWIQSLRVRVQDNKNLPKNLILTASRGGRSDNLIDLYGLRETVVVHSEAEAAALGLEIDHDDSHAARPSLKDQSFALLIHGTQPKGSSAAQALKILKRDKVQHSYSRKAAKV